jgi:hypothetical protein
MVGIVVLSRVRRTLLSAGLALAALPVGSALASTTVGQTGMPLPGFVNNVSDGAENDAAMPTAGVVTSLNTQSASACLVVGTYDLQVLRPLGSNQYRVLGDTGNQTDPCDGQLHSYAVDIPVQAGDVIGVYVVQPWQGVLEFQFGPGNENFQNPISEPAVGDTITLPMTEFAVLDESATLASASDLSNTLVNDTGQLKPGTAMTDKATAIQAAVSAGDTATVCADITDFLDLVKAQTGKKVSSANVTTLTTDANNLAAALGC